MTVVFRLLAAMLIFAHLIATLAPLLVVIVAGLLLGSLFAEFLVKVA